MNCEEKVQQQQQQQYGRYWDVAGPDVVANYVWELRCATTPTGDQPTPTQLNCLNLRNWIAPGSSMTLAGAVLGVAGASQGLL